MPETISVLVIGVRSISAAISASSKTDCNEWDGGIAGAPKERSDARHGRGTSVLAGCEMVVTNRWARQQVPDLTTEGPSLRRPKWNHFNHSRISYVHLYNDRIPPQYAKYRHFFA